LLSAKLGLALTLVVFAGCGGSSGGGGLLGSGLYTVGGTVSGPTGTVVLRDNGADDLSVSADGAFTFATKVADGAGYSVTVKTQPSIQTCIASSNTGTVAGANLTNVSVVCASWTGTKKARCVRADYSCQRVAVDSSGNVYVAGYTDGDLDGNTLTGTNDFFVTMYDPSGNKQ
jgi:hypothetical protein